MIRISRRSANEDDLRALLKPPEASLVRNVLRGSLPVAGLVFVVTLLLTRSALIAGAIGSALFAVSLASNVFFFRSVATRAARAANHNDVEVIEVEAFRVFDIEPAGSHGPALVFFSDDGRAVLLIGQWLLEQPSFPSMSFRLARWADTKRPIRIEVTGAMVTPEHSTVRVPRHVEDIEIFAATPETLAPDLDQIGH